MHLLFVGDTHGTEDLDKIKRLVREADMRENDVMIHCGDIGVAWMGEEDEALRWWRSLPFRVLVCAGNHENYSWLNGRPVETRWGAKMRLLGGSLYAPLPGETVRLAGRSLWFYPGGCSIDFMFRRPGFSIYADELLPKDEAETIIAAFLRKKRVDYVVSHDGPVSFMESVFGYRVSPPSDNYFKLFGETPGGRAHPAHMLERVLQAPEKFTRWYFGHHHRDAALGKLRCLWNVAALENTLNDTVTLIDLERED